MALLSSGRVNDLFLSNFFGQEIATFLNDLKAEYIVNVQLSCITVSGSTPSSIQFFFSFSVSFVSSLPGSLVPVTPDSSQMNVTTVAYHASFTWPAFKSVHEMRMPTFQSFHDTAHALALPFRRDL